MVCSLIHEGTHARILQQVRAATWGEWAAYLLGAMHDGTINRRHGTIRIAQAGPAWLAVLQEVLRRLGHRSWIYREGETRRVWVVESRVPIDRLPTPAGTAEKAAYARGYFDAEGGLPRHPSARYYIQVSQRDRLDLEQVRAYLEDLGVRCGRIHNPSARVDPAYWRFYVLAGSHAGFVRRVGSWHPRKAELLMRCTDANALASEWSKQLGYPMSG